MNAMLFAELIEHAPSRKYWNCLFSMRYYSFLSDDDRLWLMFFLCLFTSAWFWWYQMFNLRRGLEMGKQNKSY